MSCHEGVSCDNCMKSNFSGKRFKCLICFDYDLCEYCQSLSVATTHHKPSHPMQCILTRNDFEKYYAGESITPESPPSFTCPYCAKLGFTETLLQEHVRKEHGDTHQEVICPVCAAMPSGEPNLVTEDLAHHLSIEHRGFRDNEEVTSSRHIRRMFYPGRGIRTRNHRSMHFSGGPIGTMNASNSFLSNNNSSSVRDSMDPITELLSQLSGVRRSTQQLQHNVATASQLQELQAQLQLERQRAAEIRLQLERFPDKLSSGSSTSGPNSNSLSYAEVVSNSKPVATSYKKSTSTDDKFLLSSLDSLSLTIPELDQQERDDLDRSEFVQELLLSMLSICDTNPTLNAKERAIPVECGGVVHAANVQSNTRDEKTLNAEIALTKQNGDGSCNRKKHQLTQTHSENPEDWHFDDDDRVPSPTSIQGHERLLQARLYSSGPVGFSGFENSTTIAANYGREDIGAGNAATKHAH